MFVTIDTGHCCEKSYLRSVAFLFPVFLVMSLLLGFGCGRDKIVEPEVNPFEGTWVEYYLRSFSLDPEGFILDSSNISFDTLNIYAPPDSMNNDDSSYFVDINPGGITVDDTLGVFYQFDLPLKSAFTFVEDSFNLKIVDSTNNLLQKELAGSYNTVADTVFFDISFRYCRYNDVFGIPYDQYATRTHSMHFRFLTPDSLMMYCICSPPDSNGVSTIELTGFAWWISPAFTVIKNFGVFTRE